VFIGAPYLAAGKTGTAQVYSLQGANYKGHALAEHLRDHALFIAFAPAEQPKIALALIVENGGWGAESAGPIARKVLDYYLVDKLKPGAEAAAVAAAASATVDAGTPVIGGGQSPAEAALPASVANASPAFSPAAASRVVAVAQAASRVVAGGKAASAPRAASAAVAPATPAARPASAPAARAASAPAAASTATAPNRKRAPKGPGGASQPAIPRNDTVQTLAPTGGIDE
jgi:penicillin-binding protein 2